MVLATLLVLVAQSASSVDSNQQLLDRIRTLLADTATDWNCTPFYDQTGIQSEARAPRGRAAAMSCRRGPEYVAVYVFVGERPEDAARKLQQSQDFLSLNRSRPMKGIGEQGYEDGQGISAWITFRQGVVFSQVSVNARNQQGRVMRGRGSEHLVTAKEFGRLIVRAVHIAK